MRRVRCRVLASVLPVDRHLFLSTMPQPKTVLIADNDPLVRQLLSRVLIGEGYCVLEAANGTEALTIARQHPHPVDLVVADVMMPEMDGFGLAAQLARDHPDIKVLYVTGHYDDSVGVRRGLRESGSPFLLKPFRLDEFTRKVQETLDVVEPAAEVFASIVGNPHVAAHPALDAAPSGVPRATRYRVRLALRYRWRPRDQWYTGWIQDISRSGLSFRVDETEPNAYNTTRVAPGTPLDLWVELPPPKLETPPQIIRGEGAVVRVTPSEKPWLAPVVAVAIQRYQVQG